MNICILNTGKCVQLKKLRHAYLRRMLMTTVLFSSLAIVEGQSRVRAWNASGQVFVVWETDTQPTLNYNIWLALRPAGSTSRLQRVGLVFEPEWAGKRLTLASPNATWRIPDGNGGLYQLKKTEGLFVYTPHDTATRLVYVTRNSDSLLTDSNRTARPVFMEYNPAKSRVKCHLQLTGNTREGFPFAVFAMWADGRQNPADARPDYPVMANDAKNGAPHVFAVYRPQVNLPAEPYPAVVCLHGGGEFGSYWSYAPNGVHYKNTGNVPVDGITIAFDDRLFLSSNGVVNEDRPSNWFGWHTQLNPTTASNAPANGLVVPYTLRRLVWTIDWLLNESPYNIDSNRISIMGNSMGGTGTLLLSRWKPEKFAAATAFVPPHYTPGTGGRLFGTEQTNLVTTETGPDGKKLRVNDFFNQARRISPVSRDFCFTRIYRGRCDDAAEWGARHLQLFNEINDKKLGFHLYWDNRDHTASDWTSDDRTTACLDIGQWVSPVRTQRCEASYQGRFRNNQSYPGFYHDDQNFSKTGQQPELGNGDPADGDAWGTWGGYYDWDVSTVTDAADRWECTVYLMGQSAVSVDNCPVDSSSCGIAIRKPRSFKPQPGSQLSWKLIRVSNNEVLQSGVVTADTTGLVMIDGLKIFKDPLRSRLIVEKSGTSGMNDLNGHLVNVYPNPAQNILTVSGAIPENCSYSLFNVYGAEILTGALEQPNIDVSKLRPGTYFLRLKGGFNFTSVKMIIIDK